MQKSLTPRFLTIGVILAWAVYALLPTWEYQQMTEEEKEELRTLGELEKTESRIIRQGLDLKGGMYIVLEADIPLLVSNLASMKDDRLNKIIDDSKEKSIKQNQDFISVFDTEVRNDGIKLSRYYHEYGASLDQIITSLNEEADDAINRVLEILQNRVDQFGVSEPTIQKQGKHRMVIAQLDNVLKGDQNLASSLKDDTKETNEVDKEESTTVSELFGEEQVTPNESTENEDFDDDIFLENPFSGLLTAIPGDMGVEEKNLYALKKLLDREEVKSTLENSNGQFLLSQQSEPITANDPKNYYKLYYLEKRPELTGGIVEEARADLGSLGGGSAGQPVVSLSMNSEGSRTWSRVTGANVGERIAIVLDQKVHMAPSIREKIPGGRTQIEGFADLNEAKDLAIILRAGALPAPVNIIEERIVGPSLGADSISQGTQAVLIGLVSVLIFMLAYYKLAGTVADFALIWNILLVLAVLASLQATLTLPGIAGLILTVGMSIDANVIIFERIREELRKGKTPKAAIDSGYDRALTTIIDANVTTLIASLVLYQFGTGPIKGFATVLFWGILISMFTAVFITRTIFNAYISSRALTKLSI